MQPGSQPLRRTPFAYGILRDNSIKENCHGNQNSSSHFENARSQGNYRFGRFSGLGSSGGCDSIGESAELQCTLQL
jgi:hypothetical protein